MGNSSFDWKFWVATFLAIIGAFCGFIVWYLDQNSKTISIEVISISELAPSGVNMVHGISLKYNDENIEKPYLQVIEIKNSGVKPIASGDFDDDISVSFGERVKILKVDQSEVHPKDLQPKFSFDEKTFKLSPLLLNSGESIRFTFLTAYEKPILNSRVRIIGTAISLKEQRGSYKNTFKMTVSTIFPSLLFFIYFHSVMSAVYAWRRKKEIRLYSLFVAFVACISATLIYTLYASASGEAVEKKDIFLIMTPAILISGIFSYFKLYRKAEVNL